MMGTILEPTLQNPIPTSDINKNSFDAREKWRNKIHPIRNQGKCGSCWAFGATEALSDRFAIIYHNDVVLSPQHLVSCDHSDYGCQGGSLSNAWSFMKTTGVVTEACYPYTSGTSQESGRCESKCQNGKAFVHYHSTGYSKSKSVDETMTEIQFNGPVEAAFTVYEDFLNYKSGVYQHLEGKMLGGHAVKCIGWGTEGGVDYWLMANSWGSDWGENGYFKIKRADCGVDNNMVYGQPGQVWTESA